MAEDVNRIVVMYIDADRAKKVDLVALAGATNTGSFRYAWVASATSKPSRPTFDLIYDGAVTAQSLSEMVGWVKGFLYARFDLDEGDEGR